MEQIKHLQDTPKIVIVGHSSSRTNYDMDLTKHVIAYNGSTWTSYGQFTGLKGDIGNTGAPGAKGETGSQGLQGLQGPQGTDGHAASAGRAPGCDGSSNGSSVEAGSIVASVVYGRAS